MPHENSERAARYRERAHALRTVARQTENKSAQAALQGVAADYELMAAKLETNADRASSHQACNVIRH